MKKALGILVLSFMLGVNTFAAQPIKVNALGKVVKSSVNPITLDYVTYVPVRMISDGLGFNVSWDGKSQTFTIEGHDVVDNSKVVIECKLNSSQAKVTKDGKTSNKQISSNTMVAAKMIEGSNYLPLRFVADQFGLQTTLRIDTIYIQKPGETVPNEERVVYVYPRTKYGTQNVYSSNTTGTMTPIRVKYGMHTYLSNNQEEYDYVMNVVEKTLNFEGKTGQLYKELLVKWEDPDHRTRMMKKYTNSFPGISEEDAYELYKIEKASGAARINTGGTTKNGVDSAYELLSTGYGDCSADAMVNLAVMDAMGYNCKSVASREMNHEWVLVQVNGVWLQNYGAGLSPFDMQRYDRVTSYDTFNNAR